MLGGLSINSLPAKDAPSLRGQLVNTTWQWNSVETVTFLPNHRVKWMGNGATNIITWTVTDEASRAVEGKCIADKTYKLEIAPDLKSGMLHIGTEKGRVIDRLK